MKPSSQDQHGDLQVLRPIGRLLLLTQLFALLLVAGGGSLLYQGARDFYRANLWVEHTQQVLDEIDTLRISLLRGGLAIRNYALSPQPETLNQVRDSNRAALEGAERLQALVSESPEQAERAFVLKAEAAEVVGWTRSILVIAERDGLQALQASLRFRARQDSAKDLRHALAAMEASERTLLDQRSKERAAEYRRLQWMAGVAALLLATFLIWSTGYAAVLFRRGHASIGDLRSTADRDPLTGLFNRRALEHKFARLADAALTVVAFDLDDFKPVNDAHGHHGGDEVLRTIAQRLTRECRDDDLIARVGGDEFVVVLTGVSQEDTATQVCQRLGDAIAEPIALGEQRVRVGASLGFSTSLGGTKLSDLIAAADAAAYEEKRRKKALPPAQRLTLVKKSQQNA